MDHVFAITLAKPPEDVWAIEVDFSQRLDTSGSEQLDLVSVAGFRLHDYDDTLQEIPLADSHRLHVEVERIGSASTWYSFITDDRPTALLRIPASYDPIVDYSVIDQDSIIIGPAEGTPANTTVSFHIRGGIDGAEYMAIITATTTSGRQHSCLITWTVQRLPYTSGL